VVSKRSKGRRDWGCAKQLPSRRWHASYKDPRTGVRVNAPGTFPTKSEATGWLAARRADLDRGLWVNDRAGKQPLADWWPGYIKTVRATRRAPTANNYEAAWRLRIEPRFGTVAVARIRPSEIDDWVADLSDSGLSPGKVRETVGVLGRVLDVVERDSAIPNNPCRRRGLPLPRVLPREKVVLSPAEILEIADRFPRREDAVLFKVLAFTGIRIGEAFALSRQNLDLDRGTLTVAGTVSSDNGKLSIQPPKNNRIRTISLPRLMCEELRDMLRSSPRIGEALLFPALSGGLRSTQNFRRDAWDPALSSWNQTRANRGSAPLSLTPHDLRATCASLLVDAGASLKDLQDHLGHADISTTMAFYARVVPGRNTDIANRLDALIRGADATPEAATTAL
jgi:integrase